MPSRIKKKYKNENSKSKQFWFDRVDYVLLFCTTTRSLEIDQINPAFNIHHIPSSISLDTPSERSASAEPSNHDQTQSKSNLPNGNLPNKSRAFSPSTVLTISDEQEAAPTRKLSKLTIMEPLDSICWYRAQFSLLNIFIHLLLLIQRCKYLKR